MLDSCAQIGSSRKRFFSSCWYMYKYTSQPRAPAYIQEGVEFVSFFGWHTELCETNTIRHTHEHPGRCEPEGYVRSNSSSSRCRIAYSIITMKVAMRRIKMVCAPCAQVILLKQRPNLKLYTTFRMAYTTRGQKGDMKKLNIVPPIFMVRTRNTTYTSTIYIYIASNPDLCSHKRQFCAPNRELCFNRRNSAGQYTSIYEEATAIENTYMFPYNKYNQLLRRVCEHKKLT